MDGRTDVNIRKYLEEEVVFSNSNSANNNSNIKGRNKIKKIDSTAGLMLLE